MKYSKRNPKILSEKRKRIKARKILGVLTDFTAKQGKNLKNLNCLDIGCSGGIITYYLSKELRNIIGIDTDDSAIEFAKKNFSSKNIKYDGINNENLIYEDCSFDVVVCNHVYEHTKNPQLLFDEIYRVLKKGGFCYFGGPNRYNIIENHHKLPFLSFLPKRIANLYIRIFTRHKVYEEVPKSYWQLRNMLKRFEVIDYLEKIIRYPKKFNAEDMVKEKSLKQRIALVFLKELKYLTPSFIWIFVKN